MNSNPLQTLFSPRSIALVGASNTQDKLGNYLAKNLVNSSYGGSLYFLNPKPEIILGVKCLQAPLEIKEIVDLWVVAIPSSFVIDLVKQIGQQKQKINSAQESFLIVISAGFKETGNQGQLLEDELVKLCKQFNIKLIGPNCLGIINNQLDSKYKYNASFAVEPKINGEISFISQSGAILSGIMDKLEGKGVGFNKIISVGNKADLEVVDFLEFLIQDENTKIITIYIEGFKNGKEFIEIAKKSTKPIIILKSGNSEAAQRAVTSHTGAIAGNNKVSKAYLSESNCVLVQNLEEFFDSVLFFSKWN